MHSLQRTYYLCNILIVVAALLLFAGCARRGTVAREPGKRPGAPAPRPQAARKIPPPAPVRIDLPDLPKPVIRVGLKSEVKSAVFSSDGPIVYTDGGATLQTSSMVTASVSFVVDVPVRFSVQLGSFSTREAALQAQANLKTRTGEPSYIFENPDLRLYQLRLGPYSSKEQSQKIIENIRLAGYRDAFYVSDTPPTQKLPEVILRDELGNMLLRTSRAVYLWTNQLILRVDQTSYRGFASVFVNKTGRLTVVNHVNFEDYLKGVVPNEIGPASQATYEALKAQAVAARTYAYKNLGQFDAEGFDLCATPRCQVYSGHGTEHALTSKAVEETRGEILTYRGEPINALYTSTCGGRTENAEFMFEGWNYAYLQSVECYPEVNEPPARTSHLRGQAKPWWQAWLTAKAGLAAVGKPEAPLTSQDASASLATILQFLGKTPCSAAAPRSLDWIGVGDYLVEQLCWQAKRDSLLQKEDYQYFLNHLDFPRREIRESQSFLFLFHEDILVPALPVDSRFNPYGRLTRGEYFQALFQLLRHYRQINSSDGEVRDVSREGIQIVNDLGVHLYPLSREAYLYQKIGDGVTPREEIACGPGDNVEYFYDGNSVRILVCEIHQSGRSLDRTSKYSFWRESFSPQQLGEKVSKYLNVGEILDLQPLSYGKSGRVYEMRVIGDKGTGVLRGIRVRWALGVRDNLFTIERTYDSRGKVSNFIFSGRGWGHGIGMCQVGALGFSKRGKDYRGILRHYYTNVELHRAY